MAGTSKRINRQGWDLEVSSHKSDITRKSFVRKLLDSGMFWFLCFVIIVAGTIGVIRYYNGKADNVPQEKNTVSTEMTDYNDSQHQEFIKSLLSAKSLQDIVSNIEISSPSVVSITVAANTNNDDITYSVNYIGARFLKEYNTRMVFEIYTHNNINDKVKLIGNANWNERRQGYTMKLIEQNY